MFVIVFLTIFIPSWMLICMTDTFEENRDFAKDQNIVEGYTNHANYSFYAFNMTPESRVMAGVELFTLVLVYCITIVSASLISNKVRSDGNCSTSNVAFRRTLSTVNAFTFIAVTNFSFSALPFMVIYFCILFTIPIGTLAMACTISNIYVPVITPLILLSNVYELRKTMRRLLGCVRRGKGEMESSA